MLSILCIVAVGFMCMQTKEHSFHGKSSAEWARLRRLQTDLEAETGNACFLGLSLADTLRQCISLGNHRAAGRVRTEFKISDRRFWWIKVAPLMFQLNMGPYMGFRVLREGGGEGTSHGVQSRVGSMICHA